MKQNPLNSFLKELHELLKKYNVNISGSDFGISFTINSKWTEKWDSSKPSYYNDTAEANIDKNNILNFIDNENNEC